MNSKYVLTLFAVLMVSGVVSGADPKSVPLVYTIEEAIYDVTIDNDRVRGQLLVSGRIISGDVGHIRLFGDEIVATDIERSRGGTLTLGHNGSPTIDFVPERSKGEFQVIISFLLRPQEDDRSRLVSFTIPSALRNSLKVTAGLGIIVLERQGIMGSDGISHFGPADNICIRYTDFDSRVEASDIEVDSFSCIKPQGRRAIVTTTFSPVRPLPVSFVLKAPKGSQMLASSLKSSWIKKRDVSSYEIKIPSSESARFWIQFAVEEETETGEYIIILPSINENNGREGNFIVEEPDDGRISLDGKGVVKNLSASSLGVDLRGVIGKNRSYIHAPLGTQIRLHVACFELVSTPPIVLESQSFYVSFEENGNVLTLLEMSVPANTGSRLKLKAVPDTEIWSLSVNDRKKKVYKDKDDIWIIPLEEEEVSSVKLSLLRKSERLGLHGRLDLELPETGIPSRTLKVGIALPSRVQLLSLEGPISPDAHGGDTGPEEFIGKPYYFSRSFYQGQGMNLAVFYKEPVKQ